MKTLFIHIFCLLFVANINAQIKENTDIKDPKAKEVLDKLSKKNRANTTMKVVFTYNLSNPDKKIDETQKGTLFLKGEKYKIDLDKLSITCDGKTKWIFTKKNKEVQVDNAVSEDDKDAIDPTKIFTMHEKGFKYKYIGLKTIDGKSCHEIKLFPEEATKKAFHTVILYIDKATDQLYKAQINAKDGNKNSYTLNKIEVNTVMADTVFIFDTKQATEIIDLRE